MANALVLLISLLPCAAGKMIAKSASEKAASQQQVEPLQPIMKCTSDSCDGDALKALDSPGELAMVLGPKPEVQVATDSPSLSTSKMASNEAKCKCMNTGKACECNEFCTEQQTDAVCTELLGACQCFEIVGKCECRGHCDVKNAMQEACNGAVGCGWQAPEATAVGTDGFCAAYDEPVESNFSLWLVALGGVAVSGVGALALRSSRTPLPAHTI